MAVDWAKLHHAYGSASDVPALLAAAHSAPAPRHYTDEPWFSLWSALYHQDDIYPASYAAVPELVAIARARADAGGIEALHLAAMIEFARHEPGAPAMPETLRPAYEAVLPRARALAEASLTGAIGDRETRELSAAVFRGDRAQARALILPPDEEEA